MCKYTDKYQRAYETEYPMIQNIEIKYQTAFF